ncbi:hypothetical protein [Actinomadura rudentiformis]|uniref:Uncharacterized protein n=1 Tax=Actinomadura rudentiformis TaxID=359158 RepID=A0A6H9Z9D8_9ACTN|nr:hypothetical protein [Actinomadura rudentiformis]KAB2352285.1 hypothetical protein F8566_00865 [Actinomadura rudentiformis]
MTESGRASGEGEGGQVVHRQRVLMLLAGFFGFAVAGTISVFPGTTGVAELLRTGTLAAANSVTTRTSVAKAVTPEHRTRVAAKAWQTACGADAVRWAVSQAHACEKTIASDHHDVAVLRPPHAPGVAGTSMPAAAERGSALPAVARSTVHVRGPPPARVFEALIS